MNKIYLWLKDIAFVIVFMALSYIILNYQSIYMHISTSIQWDQEIEETNTDDAENIKNNSFILFDNSKEAKRSKENDIFIWNDIINNISWDIANLILIKKDNNRIIENKLQEKRDNIIKNNRLSINQTENDDFFSLSFEMSIEEKNKYNNESYIVIPKINVSAPIFYPDIEESDLESHIMKLLEKWVVHRPETQIPYQKGNFFILWHSSNYAWLNSEYNNIFAKLDLMDLWDEVIVYYKWRKYIYELYEKKIVDPSAIEVYWYITWYNLSIMTCYPIGSVKSRLIAIFKLKKNL